jgi:hypothetical protein
MMNRRLFVQRVPFVAAGFAAAATLTGCAGLGGPPVLRFSADEIDNLVARQFPLERRVLELFDLRLTGPKVALLAERNRLATTLEIAARERFLRSEWKGRLAFDAALRWEPSDRSVRLAQVRVQDFAFEGSAGANRSGAERLGGALIERAIEDLSLYTLPAERAEQLAKSGYRPAAVTVTSRGVEITFEASAR